MSLMPSLGNKTPAFEPQYRASFVDARPWDIIDQLASAAVLATGIHAAYTSFVRVVRVQMKNRVLLPLVESVSQGHPTH